MPHYHTAIIHEEQCIGCTRCIQACPFDAIIGAQKQVHSILTAECTGCGLCIAPCPVDCIELKSIPAPLYDRDKIKKRRIARKMRHAEYGENQQKLASIPENAMAAQNTLAEILARIQK